MGVRRWRRTGHRGVSDVVATILLLALTVTLFASIFAFVTAFPSPPAQNNNQFQASLSITSNMSYVSAIHILHLAGPVVAGNALVYLKSANQPTATEFQNPYTVSSGLSGATVWNLGQVWNLTFPIFQRPIASGNITIYVVASSQLLYSVILPGTSIVVPPTILSTWISPAPPTVGSAFTVYASIAGTYTAQSVYVNLAGVPSTGALNTVQKMTQNSQGQWTFLVGSGLTTTSGTFYGFVNASSSSGSRGQQTTGAVVITISGTSIAAITVSPATGIVGATISPGVSGSNFAPFTVVSSVTLSMYGITVIPTFTGATTGACPGSGTTIQIQPGSTSFTCAFTVPIGVVSGVLSLVASDATSGQTATTTFTVTPWTLTVSPTTGAHGSTVPVTLTGTAFAAGSTVLLYYNGAVITPTGGSSCAISGTNVVTTTGTGGFVCTYTVPTGTAGTYLFQAIGLTTGQVAQASFVRT
jgi:hypothetical protein